MNVLIGNGINYEQFPQIHHKDFIKNIKIEIQSIFGKILRIGTNFTTSIHSFLSKLIINVLKEEEFESMYRWSDISYVLSNIELNEFIWLLKDSTYERDLIIELYINFQSAQSGLMEAILHLNTNKMMKLLSELSLVYFSTFSQVFNTAIFNIFQNWNMNNLSYSKKLSYWLKGFKNIFTLNVDGILNKENYKNVIYVHGYISNSTKDYYIDIKKNIKNQNPEIYEGYNKLLSLFKVSPYEVLFNYSSYAKEETMNVVNDIKNGYIYKWSAHTEENLDWITKHFNKSRINFDSESYHKLSKVQGDFVVIGVSLSFDETIFRLLNNNEFISKVYYYGSKDEYKKIKDIFDNKKFIFCGLFNSNAYS